MNLSLSYQGFGRFQGIELRNLALFFSLVPLIQTWSLVGSRVGEETRPSEAHSLFCYCPVTDQNTEVVWVCRFFKKSTYPHQVHLNIFGDIFMFNISSPFFYMLQFSLILLTLPQGKILIHSGSNRLGNMVKCLRIITF